MPENARYRGLVSQLFEADFLLAQGIWVEGFLELLVELRRVFGNDLDKVMILSAVGQQMLRDPAAPTLSKETAHRRGSSPIHSERRTNIDALARATGIPRESVRRKVNELQAAGLVCRTGDGLRVQSGAAAALQSSTEVEIAMLDRVIAAYLAALVARGLLAATSGEAAKERKPNGTS